MSIYAIYVAFPSCSFPTFQIDLRGMKQVDTIEMCDVWSPFAVRGQLKITAAIWLPSGSDCTRSLHSSSGRTPHSVPHVDDLWGEDNTAATLQSSDSTKRQTCWGTFLWMRGCAWGPFKHLQAQTWCLCILQDTERIQARGWGLSCKKQLGPGRISRVKLRQFLLLNNFHLEKDVKQMLSDSHWFRPMHGFSSVPTLCMIFCPCGSICIQAWWHQRKTFIWTLCDPTVPNMSTGVMATEVLWYTAL